LEKLLDYVDSSLETDIETVCFFIFFWC
jgi:hypothetical protein